MGWVTGAQGRVIHSWPLCFPELKGAYHVHGGKNDQREQITFACATSIECIFLLSQLFFYITWALQKSRIPSITLGRFTSSETPYRGDLLSQCHKSCSDAHPPPGFSRLPARRNNGAKLPRHQGERSQHPTELPDLGADPTASTTLSQKQVFFCPLQCWQGISARGASEGFLPQNSPFTGFFFIFLFSFPHRKGLYGKLTAGHVCERLWAFVHGVFVGFYSSCFYPWNWSRHVFRDTCLFYKARGLSRGTERASQLHWNTLDLESWTEWQTEKKKKKQKT